MKTVGRPWQFLVNLSPVHAGVLLFAISFLVRLAFIVAFHPYRDLGRYELERTAISLATTGVYGNPYAVPTGPTAHVSPGYTLLLAGLFRMFGMGIPAEIVKELLATTVVSFQYGLLPWVAIILRIDRRAGMLAGLVSALYPATPLVQIDGDWETPYTALALMLITVLSVRLWTRHELTMRNALLHGISWGVSLLFVSALFDIWLVFVIAGIYFCRRAGIRRYLFFASLEVLTVAVCLAPWAIRNFVALGSPILTRSNLGIELRVSNNDFANGDQRMNYLNGVYARYHPLLNREEAMKVRELGEVAYNKQVGDDAKQWIRTHPGRFLHLCLDRARCFWLYHDPTSAMKTLFLNATVLLGFAGFVYVFLEQRVTGAVVAIILFMYPLPNYLIHVGVRQEYPIEWLMTLLTAVLILQLISGFSRRQARVRTSDPASLRDTPARY